MKLIVAGNVRQFERYCQVHGLSPTEAKYITDPNMLYGYEKPEIVLCGSWWENPIADTVRQLQKESRNPGRSKLVFDKKAQKIKRVKINRWERLRQWLRNVNK